MRPENDHSYQRAIREKSDNEIRDLRERKKKTVLTRAEALLLRALHKFVRYESPAQGSPRRRSSIPQ